MTAPRSSSVCRLPFISASARPERTSWTALVAASWLLAASTMSNALTVKGALGGYLLNSRCGSHQYGDDELELCRLDRPRPGKHRRTDGQPRRCHRRFYAAPSREDVRIFRDETYPAPGGEP